MFSSYVTAPKAVTGGDMSSFLSSFHWMRLQIVSALIGDWVTVTKNDWLRLLPRETFFFKKRFLPTKQFLTNMFGRAKMASSVLFCRAGVFCGFAFVFCEYFRVERL